MSVLSVEVLIKINKMLKFDYTPKGNRSLYYTRCEAEIVKSVDSAAIPMGKVIFTVFENTKDTEKNESHKPYFIGGETLHLSAINYEPRSSANARYVPAEYIGQITTNPKQINDSIIAEVPKEEVKEVKIEPPKIEENAETIDLSTKIEKLKQEISELEGQKDEADRESRAAKYMADQDKSAAEQWSKTRDKIREEINTMQTQKRELWQEIENAKKTAIDTVEKTRAALVNELLKILPNGDSIIKLQIDVRELKRGNDKAFLWTKKE